MGVRLRARLPKSSGLTPELAEDYAENPRQVVVIAILDVDQVVHHFHDENSTTTTFELIALEPFEGDEADELRATLRKAVEDRTGERALFDSEGAPDPSMFVPGTTTGDPAEYAAQLDAYRRERELVLREKAVDEDDPGKAADLDSEADVIASGARDDELRAELAPAFSDMTQPTLSAV